MGVPAIRTGCTFMHCTKTAPGGLLPSLRDHVEHCRTPERRKGAETVDLTSAFLRFVSRLDGRVVALSLALILLIVSLVISLSAAATASPVHGTASLARSLSRAVRPRGRCSS